MRDVDLRAALPTLFERLVAADLAISAKMFNSLGLKVGNRFVAFVHRDGLGIRLPPLRVIALIESGDALPFLGSRQRAMSGWAVVPYGSAEKLEELLREAIASEGSTPR